MPRLIVNADDFGYTDGINRAIIELQAAGALSSATLMARGASIDDAISISHPSSDHKQKPAGQITPNSEHGPLGVGCHVVLVDGAPTLTAGELPTLCPTAHLDKTDEDATPARFRISLAAFAADLLRGRIHETEIEREAVAQIRSIQKRGIRVTHLDTHKHTHMFPRVLRPLLRAALQCGVRAVRNPFEPAWSVRATCSAGRVGLVRRAEVKVLSLYRGYFGKAVAEAGLRTTAGALGVLATGVLDGAHLQALLASIPRTNHPEDEAWELVCHPGYNDAALAGQNTRLRAAREIERQALLAVVPGFSTQHQLISFADLQ